VYANEKSDKVIVPKKHSNKEGLPCAEIVEERTLPKRNTSQATAVQTLSRGAASSGLAGVRQTGIVRRSYSREEPSAVSSARWDLFGGYRVTGIPTATIRSNRYLSFVEVSQYLIMIFSISSGFRFKHIKFKGGLG